MARHQYRVTGDLTWQSNSGNALLSIVNKNGSGKKITLRSVEVVPLSSTTTATAGSVAAAASTVFALARATVAGGSDVSLEAHDTNATSWPSAVRVVRRATVASPTILRRIFVSKRLNQTTLSWMSMHRAHGPATIAAQPRKDLSVEGYTIRAGEAIALYTQILNNNVPLRVTATLVRIGSPDRTYTVRYFTSALSSDEAIFAVDNVVGSGETVVLRSLAIEEVGTYDSPYLQLVPVGATVDAGAADAPVVVRLDTSSPDPSTWVDARTDVPILPSGVPESYFSEASAGSPKGFSYLKTKDFEGPRFRVVFPEYVAHRPGALPDVLAVASHRAADIGVRAAGITIREGEGIAIVSAAETAAGATAAVGVSGWSSFEFAVTFDVEPKITPTLTLTGLKNPSEVRVFRGGTTDLLAGEENVTTGSFSWTFDPDDVSSVDIAILALGYQNLRIISIALALADVSIPVQQQIDRQYFNP